MKKTIAALSIILALAVPAAMAAQSEKTMAPAGSSAIDRIKALEGEWEGTDPEGKVVMRTTMRTFAHGKSVLETQHHTEGHEMVTVYHLDGEDLVLSHFCAVGNQPRMRASGANGRSKFISFEFDSATNLPDPNAGHMHDMRLTLEDADHFTQEWVWSENGEEIPKVIHFRRKS